MIFVTVGTHEQPFNRLIECLDKLVERRKIKEEVIIQIGYSTYEPKYCKWQKFYQYQEIRKLVGEARIVITHGGPSSFIMPLQIGKIPIVVPRQYKYGEHVNDHQVKFAHEVSVRMRTIIVIVNIDKLEDVIDNYEELVKSMNNGNISNNTIFCDQLNKIVGDMFQREIERSNLL